MIRTLYAILTHYSRTCFCATMHHTQLPPSGTGAPISSTSNCCICDDDAPSQEPTSTPHYFEPSTTRDVASSCHTSFCSVISLSDRGLWTPSELGSSLHRGPAFCDSGHVTTKTLLMASWLCLPVHQLHLRCGLLSTPAPRSKAQGFTSLPLLQPAWHRDLAQPARRSS